jgi:hypothetical protein
MSVAMLIIAIWGVAIAGLMCLLLYRKFLEQYEDDFLHITHADVQSLRQQATTSHKLDVLDRWVRVILLIVITYGACLAAAYLYRVWESRLYPYG